MNTTTDRRWAIFVEIDQERHRQDAKWGEQKSPARSVSRAEVV